MQVSEALEIIKRRFPKARFPMISFEPSAAAAVEEAMPIIQPTQVSLSISIIIIVSLKLVSMSSDILGGDLCYLFICILLFYYGI